MEGQYSNIDVRDTPNGKGLFATTEIPANTTLLKIDGHVLNFAQCVSLDENESYCLQIEKDKYLLPHFPFFFSNHCCEPNCGIKPDLLFVTIRDIKAGEELRWDYSTSMLERYWTMQCNCGARSCRKQIQDFDTLPLPLQRHYIARRIVLPFILEFLGY